MQVTKCLRAGCLCREQLIKSYTKVLNLGCVRERVSLFHVTPCKRELAITTLCSDLVEYWSRCEPIFSRNAEETRILRIFRVLFFRKTQETDAVVVEILVLGVFGEKPRKSTIHLLQKAFMLFKGLLLQYGGAQLTAASKGTNSNNVE